MSKSDVKDGNLTEHEETHTHASLVKLTMDDPVNGNFEKGTVLLQPGTCEDGVAYHVVNDEEKGFTPVTCDVLEVFESDTEMSRDDIEDWGVQQAKKLEGWDDE